MQAGDEGDAGGTFHFQNVLLRTFLEFLELLEHILHKYEPLNANPRYPPTTTQLFSVRLHPT